MSHESRHKSILALLDSSVRWTGIPDLAEWRPRRRPLRWPSLIALIFAVVGFAADFGQPKIWWGYALLMLGFSFANFMPIWGPIKPWASQERVDEFDRTLRDRAFLVAFRALGLVAVVGLWLTVGISASRGWDADSLRWTVTRFAFLLATIYSAGPTCYASWTQLPTGDDD